MNGKKIIVHDVKHFDYRGLSFGGLQRQEKSALAPIYIIPVPKKGIFVYRVEEGQIKNRNII
jgi:hypothetical protein